MSASRHKLTAALKQEANRLGFPLTGVVPSMTPGGIQRFYQWLQAGYAGQMTYLTERQVAYADPQHVLPGARSLLMLGMPYRNEPPRPAGEGEGLVSRYAWGTRDYHDVIHQRMKQLVHWLKQQQAGCEARGVVDTAPLLEREFAQLAGLGWVGKNTLLLNRQLGSWFFLAAILTDVELDYDDPFTADHCGSCRACLDACPTDAFPQPYVLDATRCISYLTIELREMIPQDLRAGMGQWVFGCDVCQDVCPWNRRTPKADEPDFQPRRDLNPLELTQLFGMDDEQFRALFRKTPLWRTRRRGLLRNAAIALGNQRTPSAIAALGQGLKDVEPMVRAACAWALGQIDHPAARAQLQQRMASEVDPLVQQELNSALASADVS